MRIEPFSYRCTLFTKQAVEIAQSQAYSINDKLHDLGLFVYPRNGTIFAIGPNGAETINVTSFEFSDSTKSLVITYDQNRIDIIYTARPNHSKPLQQFVNEVKTIIDAFQEIIIEIQRCALATSQVVLDVDNNIIYGKLVIDENTDIFEWNVRKVTKTKIEGFPQKPINFVSTMSRNMRKLPLTPSIVDAVCLETDFNTDASFMDILSSAEVVNFLNLMVSMTDETINKYSKRLI